MSLGRQAALPIRDAAAQVTCYTSYVANLTLAIDEETLRRARIRAVQEGTSVNAVVREQLRRYAGTDERAMAGRRKAADLARAHVAGNGSQDRDWTREDLYEERGRWPRS